MPTIIPLVILGFLLVVGFPIGFALLLSGFIGYSMITSFDAAFSFLGSHAYGSIAKFLFTPIPLFVLMSEILAVSGIGASMYDTAMKWFGRFRGGLGVATVIACAIFAAMCGLSMASAAAIGVVAIPEMRKRGYSDGLATGLVCCAGTLGILIPPSLPFIVYGVIGQQSVGQLFMAGVLPGVLLASLYSLYILTVAWLKPDYAPGVSGITWRDRILSLKRLWMAILLIFSVLGSIYLGIATPTEAAGIGAFGALLMGFGTRTLNYKGVLKAVENTVNLVGFVMILVVGAMFFSFFLTITRVTHDFSVWLASLQVSPWFILLGIFIILQILGMFLDSAAIILITTPLFLPIVTGLGIDPVLYGVILVMNIEIAFVTPPVGMNLYVIGSIAPDVPLGTVLRGSVPFLLLTVVGMVIVLLFPQIALWLPAIMVK